MGGGGRTVLFLICAGISGAWASLSRQPSDAACFLPSGCHSQLSEAEVRDFTWGVGARI